jgi:hypothetical protein
MDARSSGHAIWRLVAAGGNKEFQGYFLLITSFLFELALASLKRLIQSGRLAGAIY